MSSRDDTKGAINSKETAEIEKRMLKVFFEGRDFVMMIADGISVWLVKYEGKVLVPFRRLMVLKNRSGIDVIYIRDNGVCLGNNTSNCEDVTYSSNVNTVGSKLETCEGDEPKIFPEIPCGCSRFRQQ